MKKEQLWVKSGKEQKRVMSYELWIKEQGKSKKELWVMSYELKSGDEWRVTIQCKM